MYEGSGFSTSSATVVPVCPFYHGHRPGVKRCLTVVLISISLRTHSRFFAQSNVTSFLSFLKWLHPFGAKVDPYFSRSGLGLISCHSSSPILCSGYWAHDGIVFVYPLGSLYPLNGSAICPLCSVPLLLCIFWVIFFVFMVRITVNNLP